MPDIPATVKPRLQAWWSSLDDGMHTIFEAIYMEAPAAVSRAISGGQWVADDAEPGLSAQLGDYSEESGPHAWDSIPAVQPGGELRMSPNVAVGTPFTMSWTESNPSLADLDGYYTDVYVEGPDGEVVESARLSNPPLPAGASVDRSFECSGAAAEGRYMVRIFMNAEGADAGVGVPGPQGLRGLLTGMFVAGQSEQEADSQNVTAWQTALQSLAVAGAQWPPEAAMPYLLDGVNWLSAIDNLSNEDRQGVEKVADWLATGATQYSDGLADEANARFRQWLQQLGGTASSLHMNLGDAAGRSELLPVLRQLSG